MTSKRSNTASAKGRDIAPGVPAQKGSVMEKIVRVPDGTGLSSASPIEPASPSRPEASIPSRDFDDDDFDYDEREGEWCDRCQGSGIANCYCGGDQCYCENYGEMECPTCDGEGYFVPTEAFKKAREENAKFFRELHEAIRDSDASLAEDPKGLSGEAVAARAEGIAQGDAA